MKYLSEVSVTTQMKANTEFEVLLCIMLFYYIVKSVLVENMPLIKFIRNYIRDSSGVFSISSLVRISLTSFPAFTLSFVQKHSCLYNKKKITRRLEDKNFIFSW